MKLLLDAMYPPALADALCAHGIDASTVAHRGLAGRSDVDILTAAAATGSAVLTENVGDFARLAAEHVVAGRHHAGVLIALSSRFSRRPDGIPALVGAARGVIHERLEDRLVYLEQPLRQPGIARR